MMASKPRFSVLQDGPYKGTFSYEPTGVPQEEAFKPRRLIRRAGSANYLAVVYGSRTDDTEKGEGLAHGWYDFVVTEAQPGICWIRRERNDRSVKYRNQPKHKDPGTDRGHSAIAEGGNVFFAGIVLFGGGPLDKKKKTEPGVLMLWQNKSGHYLCGMTMTGEALKSHVAHQTRFLKGFDEQPLLPMDKFVPYDPSGD